MQSSARSSRDAGRASRASLAHVVVNFRPRIHRRVVWFDVRQLRRVAHRPRDGQGGRTGRTDRQLDRRTRALDCSNAPARGSRWFFLLFGTFFARSRPARTHFACFERHVSDAPDRDRPRPAPSRGGPGAYYPRLRRAVEHARAISMRTHARAVAAVKVTTTTTRASHARANRCRRSTIDARARRARTTTTTTTTRASAQEQDATEDAPDVENCVIIGSGPAGYTAAIYAGRANLRPLMFEGFQAGGVPGGQLMTTTEVENFPGFPEGVTGPDLMDKMRKQAERWGAVMHTEDVVTVDFTSRPFTVSSSDRTVKANSVIVATGATAKRLGIPAEATLWSRGISACAICDGASPIFKGEEVAVVGGGDTATEEAVYLTKYAKHVHLLVRGSTMRASKAMQDRVLQHKAITVHYNTECVDGSPNSKGNLGALKLRDTNNGDERQLKVKGLFYGIGHTPNSKIFGNQIELDEAGYVVVREGTRTSIEGVFSAGDLHDQEFRQAITAAGSGCMAAISVERYLTEKNLLVEHHQTKQRKSVEREESVSEEERAIQGEDEDSFDINVTKHYGQYALRKLYHESDRVVMVMYSAPTCGPCRRLKPMLDKVIAEYGDKVHYVEIDIAADPEIAEAAGVTGTPMTQIFYQKERIEVLSGVKMKSEYRRVIDGALGASATKEVTMPAAQAGEKKESPVETSR